MSIRDPDDEYVWLADITFDQAQAASQHFTELLNEMYSGKWHAHFSSFSMGDHVFFRDDVKATLRARYSLTKKELWECIHSLVPDEELERIDAESTQYAGMMHLIREAEA